MDEITAEIVSQWLHKAENDFRGMLLIFYRHYPVMKNSWKRFPSMEQGHATQT